MLTYLECTSFLPSEEDQDLIDDESPGCPVTKATQNTDTKSPFLDLDSIVHNSTDWEVLHVGTALFPNDVSIGDVSIHSA